MSDLSALNGLGSSNIGLDGNLILFSSDDLSLFTCELLLLFDSDRSNLKHFFKIGNLLLSLLELDHTTVVFIAVVFKLLSLNCKHRFK
jgi:hypothetical protein